nr:IS630 family transposase [Paraneptunicella aestuarii]
MLKKIDFTALSKKETNAAKRIRLLALAHYSEGMNKAQIARTLKVSRASVNKWVAAFLDKGIDGLDAKSPPGRPASLSSEQIKKLSRYIEYHSRSDVGGRLTGADIQAWISSHLNVDYKMSNIYRLLHQWGFSWISSRSKHPKQSQNAQEEFKKLEINVIKLCPGHLSLNNVDIWFQDEARFGQQNTTSRLWARTGSRPRAVKQQQFEYAYLFGAVCPATGETEALITPWVNKDAMTLHLKQISERTKPGRMAVVIMDGAGWHTEDTIQPFDNIRMLKLPPYSPELNPVEQVWSWLRQHALSNRIFEGYEDIVDACSDAWNTFVKDTHRVISLCTRKWAQLNG